MVHFLWSIFHWFLLKCFARKVSRKPHCKHGEISWLFVLDDYRGNCICFHGKKKSSIIIIILHPKREEKKKPGDSDLTLNCLQINSRQTKLRQMTLDLMRVNSNRLSKSLKQAPSCSVLLVAWKISWKFWLNNFL